jgi:hypothetical protein
MDKIRCNISPSHPTLTLQSYKIKGKSWTGTHEAFNTLYLYDIHADGWHDDQTAPLLNGQPLSFGAAAISKIHSW